MVTASIPTPGYMACSLLVLGVAALYALFSIWWVRRDARAGLLEKSRQKRLENVSIAVFLATAALWCVSEFRSDWFTASDFFIAQSDGTILVVRNPRPPESLKMFPGLFNETDLVAPMFYGGEFQSPMWCYAFGDAEPRADKGHWFGYMCIAPARSSVNEGRLNPWDDIPGDGPIQAIVLPHWPLLLLASIFPSVRMLNQNKKRIRKADNDHY